MTAIHTPGFRLGSLPALLWCAGIVAMLALTGGDAWPLALGWACAGVVLVRVGRPLVWAALIPVLIVLTWEGGLFLVPAALAALVVSLRARGSA